MSAALEVQSETIQKTAPWSEDWDPKVIAFLCNWCSYAGADLAGISRIQYPPNVRVVRVPCSGRVNPLYIIKALQHGADGVLVSGCHPGDCHYISGNYYARRRFTVLKSLLEAVGIEPGRVNFSWVSAAEGEKFSQVVTNVVEQVKALGPSTRLVKAAPGRTNDAGSGDQARQK
jgi:coenzyme F420-reducing hydrogenase delta subunit